MFWNRILKEKIKILEKGNLRLQKEIDELKKDFQNSVKESFAQNNRPKYKFGKRGWAWMGTYCYDGQYYHGKVCESKCVYSECSKTAYYQYRFISDCGKDGWVTQIHNKKP